MESIYTIGNKWSLVIIHNLMNEPKRFNELKSCIDGISSKVLTQNLSELQRNGIIEKKTISDLPEKTEYVLTEKGKDLRTVMSEMRMWGERWLLPPAVQSGHERALAQDLGISVISSRNGRVQVESIIEK